MLTAAVLLLLAGLSLPVASARADARPAAAEQPPRTVPARACGRGSTPAVVGRRLRCLRAGSRCEARFEADYRRYRYTCVKGVLRRR